MKRVAQRNTRSLLVLLINIVLVAGAAFMYGQYASMYQERLREENLGNIANLNQSAATNATALLDSWEIKLEDVSRYVERHQMTAEQALETIDDANASEERLFELLDSEYEGYLVRRDASGAFIPVSYQHHSYEALQRVLDDCGDPEHQGVHFAPEFTGSYSAVKHFGLCKHLTLMDAEGQPRNYALLLAGRSRDVLAVFNNQNVYEGLSSVLVDGSGNYIISNDDFKSNNFFQYLYVYNDLTLDERSAIQQNVQATGKGDLFYQNSMGQDCVFRYVKMKTSDWYCITCVPLSSFRATVFDSNYAKFAVIALLIILAVDVVWLRGINRRMRVSMQREKEASEAKTDFLSRMSHDIRTPLNGIIGMTELAMDEPNPPKTEEYLDNIKASGDFLLGLVNDILDMSKVESGKMELHPESYAVGEFTKYIRAVIEPLCQSKGLELRVEPSGDDQPVMLDRLRFNQIFFNLLSNAVKYTPSGGLVEIAWTKKRVRPGRVAFDFMVRDNGIGMSEEYQQHMFESFSREHAEVSIPGAGLGLSIVWNLVRLMGGTIKVESKLGEGSTFHVMLEADVSSGEEKPRVKHLSGRLEGKRALICEDNDINAKIAVALLQKWGMTCDVAENGRIGLERFENSQPGWYDAILMDIRMPEMNGLDATRAIRRLDRADAASVPILAMTANAYDIDVQNCLDAGMNAHLGKPIQAERLRQKLEELVK